MLFETLQLFASILGWRASRSPLNCKKWESSVRTWKNTAALVVVGSIVWAFHSLKSQAVGRRSHAAPIFPFLSHILHGDGNGIKAWIAGWKTYWNIRNETKIGLYSVFWCIKFMNYFHFSHCRSMCVVMDTKQDIDNHFTGGVTR